MGEAFPADNPVARWLTSLTMGLNDLLHVNKRLVRQLEDDAPPYINVYEGRLAGSHAWEVLKLMRDGGANPQVAAFLDGLSEIARRDYAEALAVYDDASRSEFKSALARARDYFSHYPELDRRELKRALEAVADHQGELHTGEAFGDFRGIYADEVAGQLFFRTDEDLEPLKEFLADLRDLTLVLMHFIQRALDAYLSDLPGGTIRPDDR